MIYKKKKLYICTLKRMGYHISQNAATFKRRQRTYNI